MSIVVIWRADGGPRWQVSDAGRRVEPVIWLPGELNPSFGSHTSFTMSAEGKSSMLAKRRADDDEDGDDEEDEPVNPIGSPLRQSARVRRP